MMMTRTCEIFDSRSTIERYVAGTTTPAETTDFESHLVGCRDCQQAVRIGAAARQALRSGSARSPRPAWGTTLAVLALAAGVVIVAGAELLSQRRIQSLGDISAPSYMGIAVRSSVADSLFDRAMRSYHAGQYDRAAELLTAARAAGADSTLTSFFAGASRLMRNDPDRATHEFRIVIGRGESPYLAEAHFYLAKSWLQRGGADSAMVHLAAAAASQYPIAPTARALSDSIAEVVR